MRYRAWSTGGPSQRTFAAEHPMRVIRGGVLLTIPFCEIQIGDLGSTTQLDERGIGQLLPVTRIEQVAD